MLIQKKCWLALPSPTLSKNFLKRSLIQRDKGNMAHKKTKPFSLWEGKVNENLKHEPAIFIKTE